MGTKDFGSSIVKYRNPPGGTLNNVLLELLVQAKATYEIKNKHVVVVPIAH